METEIVDVNKKFTKQTFRNPSIRPKNPRKTIIAELLLLASRYRQSLANLPGTRFWKLKAKTLSFAETKFAFRICQKLVLGRIKKFCETRDMTTFL